MTKKFILILLAVIGLWIIAFGAFLWLQFGRLAPTSTAEPTTPVATESGRPAPTSTPTSGTGVSQNAAAWAQTMIKKYPYKSKERYGVLPAKRADEVWVVGFRTGSGVVYPPRAQGAPTQQYAGVKNSYGQFQGLVADDALYTIQRGDDLTQAAEATPPATIKSGDLVATRMTFADNFGLILEIRRLLTE